MSLPEGIVDSRLYFYDIKQDNFKSVLKYVTELRISLKDELPSCKLIEDK